MVIKIDKNYTVVTDKICSTLKYEKSYVDEKTGKTLKSKDVWYCSNLKSALKKYVNLKVGEANEICEIIDKIELVEEAIEKLW